MAKILFKKSYLHKFLTPLPFDDLWGKKGVFTTIRVVGNPPKFILLDEHVMNLNISLKKFGINFILTHQQMNELIHTSIYDNTSYDHLLRIAINSKKISISLRPRVQFNKFFTATIVNDQRVYPLLKNLYYKKIISLLENNNNSSNEVILTKNGLILEGCTTNILCVRMKKIYMPITHYYKGVTLKYIINKNRKKIIKRNIFVKDLSLYEEILLLGSGKGVVNISAIPEINWKKQSDSIYKQTLSLYKKLI
jgi:branched-subunit amino acid aminotransferase/4-amino-4-deoxychorismate lyase